MKHAMMVVRDIKVEAYGQPFCTPSVGIGIRSFTDAVNNPQKDSDISKHPGDFDLFHLGNYDDNTGQIEQFQMPKHILNGEGAKNVQK